MKGIMPEQNVEPNTQAVLKPRPRKHYRPALAALVLLTFLALAAVAVNNLPPNVPGRTEGVPARLSWYLDHGQFQADAQTFVAAVQFILTPDGELPAATKSANPAVAGQAAPATPKS